MKAPREVRVLEVFERDAAVFVAERLAALQADGKTVSLALSGGATPGPVLGLLARPPLRRKIDWDRVLFFWSDERCVPPDHPESNYALARRVLLEPLKVPGLRVHRIEAEAGAEAAAERYCAVLRRFAPNGLDLLLLGVGADGHTASLFPRSPVLTDFSRPAAAAVSPAGQARVTLTPPALTAAREVVVLARGAEKAQAVRACLDDKAPPPAGLARGREKTVWLLDAAAASLLKK